MKLYIPEARTSTDYFQESLRLLDLLVYTYNLLQAPLQAQMSFPLVIQV